MNFIQGHNKRGPHKNSDNMTDTLILTDSNVARCATTLIERVSRENGDAPVMVVEAGEQSKTLDTARTIWERMIGLGLTRRSMLICIGGGMVTDLGGFAAACFKRGIRHKNISTTLLGAVDASIGGKTGVDFDGYKNEIGAFHMPIEAIADVESFSTLPDMEILSGWGEALKTGYIDSAGMTARMLAADPVGLPANEMKIFVDYCRRVKMRVVGEDPTEKGLRKILNFGHTAGHAFESLMLTRQRPVAHGVAVAHGMLVSLILSHIILDMPSRFVSEYATRLKEIYPRMPITCRDFADIISIAKHDKKNSDEGFFNFVLLSEPGHPVYDCKVDETQLKEALDLYITMM